MIVRNKRVEVRPDTGEELLRVDVEAAVRGIVRSGRIKARFVLTDRFGAPKKSMEWTTGLLRPGERIVERGVTFRLMRTGTDDAWLRAADVREFRGRFEDVQVVYGAE